MTLKDESHNNQTLDPNNPNIFVFGSNLAGRHGAGSAKEALEKHGAVYGLGVGFYGNSYAIPTKDYQLKVLPIHIIKPYVDEFLEFANNHFTLTFNVVAIGCGLAGYKPEQIAPLFKYHSPNVILPKEFIEVLQNDG